MHSGLRDRLTARRSQPTPRLAVASSQALRVSVALSESGCRGAAAELWLASSTEERRSMAVSISGYSVVVHNKTIGERFPGTLSASVSLCPNETLCTDGKVTRVGFMSLADAEIFLSALAERGLTPAEKGVSVDAAVV